MLRKIYESLTQLATESRKKCFQKEGSLLSDIRRMGRLQEELAAHGRRVEMLADAGKQEALGGPLGRIIATAACTADMAVEAPSPCV